MKIFVIKSHCLEEKSKQLDNICYKMWQTHGINYTTKEKISELELLNWQVYCKNYKSST